MYPNNNQPDNCILIAVSEYRDLVQTSAYFDVIMQAAGNGNSVQLLEICRHIHHILCPISEEQCSVSTDEGG